METTFHCDLCGADKPRQASGGTGYGRNKAEQIVCYECCGKIDREDMIQHGDATLYLTEKGVTNWPGTLCFPTKRRMEGRHNIARVRHDVWFTGPDGFIWHGVAYGNSTQICHCKRTKRVASVYL